MADERGGEAGGGGGDGVSFGKGKWEEEGGKWWGFCEARFERPSSFQRNSRLQRKGGKRESRRKKKKGYLTAPLWLDWELSDGCFRLLLSTCTAQLTALLPLQITEAHPFLYTKHSQPLHNSTRSSPHFITNHVLRVFCSLFSCGSSCFDHTWHHVVGWNAFQEEPQRRQTIAHRKQSEPIVQKSHT